MNIYVAWFLKDIMVPLLPVICGTIVRYIQTGAFDFEITELSFSMAILFMFQLKSISKKATTTNDKNLIEGLESGAKIAITICLGTFIISLMTKIGGEKHVGEFVENILKIIKENKGIDEVKKVAENYSTLKLEEPSNRLKIFMYWLSGLSIPFAAFFKFYYKLDD